MTDKTEPVVILSREGSLGRVHLNRPKAINSLTLEMVQLIKQELADFAQDDSIASVLLSGEGARGLCAGGDIIALYKSGRSEDGAALDFWAQEYVLNAQIANYPKPYIAFMDGITMGGGLGISMHGSHRIVTERTRLAMPETGIGFFPDVGGSWIMSHSAGQIGTYIGLTGKSITAADAIYAGFADHFMSSDNLPSLVTALAALPAGADHAVVTDAIEPLSTAAPTSEIAKKRSAIDAAFAGDTVEEIFTELQSTTTPFAQKTLETLRQKSPTSLKIALTLLRAAKNSASLRACLDREFAAIAPVMAGHDFYEGVRAAVLDKGRNPKWQPASLDAVQLPDFDALVAANGTLFENNTKTGTST